MNPSHQAKTAPWIDPSWLRGIGDIPPPEEVPPPVRLILRDLVDASHRLEGYLHGLPHPLHGEAPATDAARSVVTAINAVSWPTPEARDSSKPARGALRFRDVARVVPAAPDIHERRHVPAQLPDQRKPDPIPYRRPFVAYVDDGPTGPGWEHDQPLQLRVVPRAKILATLALVSSVIAGVGAAMTYLVLDRPGQAAVIPAPVAVQVPSPGPLANEQTYRLAEATVRGFHQARTPEEKAAYVRGGQSQLPRLRQYYASHPPEPPVETMLDQSLDWLRLDGRLLVNGLIVTTSGELRQFTVELNGADCKLDWQSHTGWKGTDWKDFLAKRTEEPTSLCVTAAPDTLFVSPFSDEARWISLRLEDPGRSGPAWGFLRRDHPDAASLLASFPGGTDTPASRRLTLTLRFPAASSEAGRNTPALEIVGVEHEGWFERAAGQP